MVQGEGETDKIGLTKASRKETAASSRAKPTRHRDLGGRPTGTDEHGEILEWKRVKGAHTRERPKACRVVKSRNFTVEESPGIEREKKQPQQNVNTSKPRNEEHELKRKSTCQ